MVCSVFRMRCPGPRNCPRARGSAGRSRVPIRVGSPPWKATTTSSAPAWAVEQLPDVRLVDLRLHPEPAAGVELLLGEEEAVLAVEVADGSRRLRHHVERRGDHAPTSSVRASPSSAGPAGRASPTGDEAAEPPASGPGALRQQEGCPDEERQRTDRRRGVHPRHVDHVAGARPHVAGNGGDGERQAAEEVRPRPPCPRACPVAGGRGRPRPRRTRGTRRPGSTRSRRRPGATRAGRTTRCPPARLNARNVVTLKKSVPRSCTPLLHQSMRRGSQARTRTARDRRVDGGSALIVCSHCRNAAAGEQEGPDEEGGAVGPPAHPGEVGRQRRDDEAARAEHEQHRDPPGGPAGAHRTGPRPARERREACLR